MVENLEYVVVGAGIIGLSIAREIALSGKEVLVLEANEDIGTGISSRSSEVIHSGIYYNKNSHKNTLCNKGRKLLYNYCYEKKIPFQKIGKLIVATNQEEKEELFSLKKRGLDNGLKGIKYLNQNELNKKEPALESIGALYVPMTGIIDSHSLMLALRNDVENNNSLIALRTPFISASKKNNVFNVKTGDKNNPTLIQSHNIINASGLNARKVAQSIDQMKNTLIPNLFFNKGSYFSMSGPAPFKHLVYPLPNINSLGIHYCLNVEGIPRFGPDHEWVKEIDYSVSLEKKTQFIESIKKYWPGIKDANLRPDYAGIRPSINTKSQHSNDFIIQTKQQHGIKGLINLFGIESPGLTAALAIAQFVNYLLNQPNSNKP